jgi:hypothetical protein
VWNVIDREKYSKDKSVVAKVLKGVTEQLERDLRSAESLASQTHAASFGASGTLAAAESRDFPSFETMRKKTREQAATGSDGNQLTSDDSEEDEQLSATRRKRSRPEQYWNLGSGQGKAEERRSMSAQPWNSGDSAGSDASPAAPPLLSKVIKGITGDASRDTVIASLAQALTHGIDLDNAATFQATVPLETWSKHQATAIEGALFDACGGVTEDYRARFRALLQCFRQAEGLAIRTRLSSGSLATVDLVSMAATPILLAPPEKQEEQSKLRSQELQSSVDSYGDWSAGASTATCNVCGARGRLQYRALAASRDIRKAEIWGTSDSGDTRFRIRCDACGSSWISDWVA